MILCVMQGLLAVSFLVRNQCSAFGGVGTEKYVRHRRLEGQQCSPSLMSEFTHSFFRVFISKRCWSQVYCKTDVCALSENMGDVLREMFSIDHKQQKPVIATGFYYISVSDYSATTVNLMSTSTPL